MASSIHWANLSTASAPKDRARRRVGSFAAPCISNPGRNTSCPAYPGTLCAGIVQLVRTRTQVRARQRVTRKDLCHTVAIAVAFSSRGEFLLE
jgi:hypothetical protein